MLNVIIRIGGKLKHLHSLKYLAIISLMCMPSHSLSLSDFKYGDKCDDIHNRFPNAAIEKLTPAWMIDKNDYLLELSGTGVVGEYTLFCDINTEYSGQRLSSVRYTPQAGLELSKVRKHFRIEAQPKIEYDLENDSYAFNHNQYQFHCKTEACAFIDGIDVDFSWDSTKYYTSFEEQDKINAMMRADSVCVYVSGDDTTSLVATNCQKSTYPISVVTNSGSVEALIIYKTKCNTKRFENDFGQFQAGKNATRFIIERDGVGDFSDSDVTPALASLQSKVSCDTARSIVKINYAKFQEIQNSVGLSNIKFEGRQ